MNLGNRTHPEIVRAADLVIDADGDLNGAKTEWASADTQTTVGAAGGASALPALPTGYLKIKVAGVVRVVPFYTEA